MNNLQTESESMTVSKILIPTIVFSITMLIPWWYWGSQNYYDSQCRQESAANSSVLGLASSSNKNPCPKASYAAQKAYETPWYDWILLGISGFYTFFACMQWWAIRAQGRYMRRGLSISIRAARAARRSAEAANLNASALMNIERAWIMIGSMSPSPTAFDLTVDPVLMEIRFKNYGRTPAWIVESALILKRSEHSSISGISESAYGSTARPLVEKPISPGEISDVFKVPLDSTNPFSDDIGKLSDVEIKQLNSGDLHLYLFGYIRYRHAFSIATGDIPEFRFCFQYLAYLKKWIYAGPPEANRST